MAVIETNQDVKAKLVYQVEDSGGEMTKTTRTFGNISPSADNDSIMAGMNALATLITDSAASVVRVDEAELVNE